MASLGDADGRLTPAQEPGPPSSPALLPEVLADLEQQATGLALAERDQAVRDLAEAAYAEVTLLERLHAAVDAPVRLRLAGGWRIEGVVERVGADFVRLREEPARRDPRWTVRIGAILTADGLPQHSRPAVTLPVVARLGLGSVLRRLVDTRCTLHDVTGVAMHGQPVRVGADFVEFDAGEDVTGTGSVVSLAAIAAIRSGS